MIKKKKRESEIPTSSLADIAFLVLVFFLLTTTIDVDKGITLTLPAKGEETKIREKNISNILINAEGQVLFDDQPVPVYNIREVVREKLLQNDKLIFSLKTDRETDYEVYVKVLDQVKQGGAKRISIAEPDK
ncbi:MAG TPA: biopolymer transporter ExbD [Bacteroidetes bacterium]|nr:biopolymer transporter ExbD [Bacteroidota bacterium]